MTDENQTNDVVESREGKLARKHKAVIANILEELVEAMEMARADGFITDFGISIGPDGKYQTQPDHPVLSKRW